MKKFAEDHYSSESQLLVTNRVIRELILHIGVEKILNNHGQLNVGSIEELYDVSSALKSQLDTKQNT